MPWVQRYLINREYARLWYGQAVSTVGDMIFDTTLVLWVATVLAKGKSWAPVAVSGIMLSVGIAVMVVGPLAGVFVDRWNRGLTMLRTEILRALMVAVLAALAFMPTSALPVWLWLTVIYFVVFVVNASEQFFNPSRFATIGDVVAGEVDRTRAAGIGQATQAVAAIVGPPLAAPLLFTVGLQWALVVNVLSYVVSFIAIRSIGLDRTVPVRVAGSSLRREFVAGLRMFAGNRFLVALLTIAVIAQLGTGAMNTLDVFFLTDNLHANAHLLGLISMVFGVGAVIGALAAGRIVKWFGARRTTWVALTVAGIVVLVYARQTMFAAGLVVFFFVAVPVTVLNTSMTPLMLNAVPREYLGRMLAVFNPINQAASMVSVVIAGWLASTALLHFHAEIGGLHLGRVDTIFTISGLLIVAGGIYASIALPPDPSAAGPDPSDGGGGGAVVGELAEIAAPGVIPTQGVTEPLIDPAGS
jgi:MFS family permease